MVIDAGIKTLHKEEEMDCAKSFLGTIVLLHLALTSNGQSLGGLFPGSVSPVEGETVTLLYPMYVNGTTSCSFKHEKGLNCNCSTDSCPPIPSGNFECFLEEHCGVRIPNINVDLGGTWTGSMTNVIPYADLRSSVTVKPSYTPPIVHDVSAVAGENVTLKVTTTGLYCRFRHEKLGEVIVIPSVNNVCAVSVTNIQESFTGNVSVTIGLPEKTEEVTSYSNVTIYEQPLTVDINFNKDKSDYNILCKLQFISISELTYCRFQHPNGTGYNIIDGLGTNMVRQYGNGLAVGECGITLMNYTDDQLGRWKCVVGLQINSTHFAEFSAYAMLTEPRQSLKNRGQQRMLTRETQCVRTMQGLSATILCRTLSVLTYCRFLDPFNNDIIVAPGTAKPTNETAYKYFGNGILAGECGITISNVSAEHNGTWRCAAGIDGVETELWNETSLIVEKANVITDQTEVNTETGRSGVLRCESVVKRSSKYCRFVKPDGTGINAVPKLNTTEYETDIDLENGICALTVKKFATVDLGRWKCVIFINDLNQEFSVYLTVKEASSSSESSDLDDGAVAGIVIAVLIAVAAVGFLAYAKITKKCCFT